jgi:hypothetical protein
VAHVIVCVYVWLGVDCFALPDQHFVDHIGLAADGVSALG